MRVLSDEIVSARKDHDCGACHAYLRAGYARHDFDRDKELAVIDACEADKYKIKAKTKYRRLVYSDGGELKVFKARLDMDALCQEHGFYED